MKHLLNRIFATISNKKLLYSLLAIYLISFGIIFFVFGLELLTATHFDYHLQPNNNLGYVIRELRGHGTEIEVIYNDTLQKEDINWFKGVYSNENLELTFKYIAEDETFILHKLIERNSGEDVSGWSEYNWIIDFNQRYFPSCFWNVSVLNHDISPIQLYKFQKEVYSNVITIINPEGLGTDFFIYTFFVDCFYLILYCMKYVMNFSLFVIILLFIIYNSIKYYKLIFYQYTPYHIVLLNFLKKCWGGVNIGILLILFLGILNHHANDGSCIYRYTYKGTFEELSYELKVLGLKSSPEDKFAEANINALLDTLTIESKPRKSYICGWFSVDDFAVKIMIDTNNSGILLLNQYINLETEEKSQSWFFTDDNWPWTKQYHASPFRLLYLNYIINRDFISRTPFDFDTIVNTSEIIVGYMYYTILYYGYFIFPIWLLLLFSSIVYKRRKRKKEYENFKKQFPPTPPLPPTND